MSHHDHPVHDGDHAHRHGEGCGHVAIRHAGHVDYLHDGHLHHPHGDHLHHPHGDHCDDHGAVTVVGR